MFIYALRVMFWTTLLSIASAFPRETAKDNLLLAPSVAATVATSKPITTKAATTSSLHCTNGSTVFHTTDCTMGTPLTYCYKPPPPIKCKEGYFPYVLHPDHCEEEPYCFPLDSDWIVTECSNGGTAYETTTLFAGTLADGEWTAVSVVSCACPTDQWLSATIIDGDDLGFCMPHRSCPPGMTTSTETDTYCATVTTGFCSDRDPKTEYCNCADPMQTPIYDDESTGEGPIGCEW